MIWKYAVHTISWGSESLDTIVREVKAAGYAGAELFQHPQELGGAGAIERAFRTHGVALVGIAAGSFHERCRLVGEIAAIRGVPLSDPNLPYVYCDEWREEASFKEAVAAGLRVALHPHMYRPVQNLQEAELFLANNPALLFLPDTAHLQVAGHDPALAIRRFAGRLAAVHLKSWREDVGRSFHFYARGFCELGRGDVDVYAVLEELCRQMFAGWLVVELDSTSTPLRSAESSLAWLRSAEKQIMLSGDLR